MQEGACILCVFIRKFSGFGQRKRGTDRAVGTPILRDKKGRN